LAASRERGGDLDGHFDALVAAADARALRHALAFDTESRAGLRACGDAELALAVERRHFDLGAERGLREGKRHRADDVVACSPEERMRCDVDLELEIAGRLVGLRSIAGAVHHARRAVLAAGR